MLSHNNFHEYKTYYAVFEVVIAIVIFLVLPDEEADIGVSTRCTTRESSCRCTGRGTSTRITRGSSPLQTQREAFLLLETRIKDGEEDRKR
jgi:hypothetical protein